jgi:WD40 repeat protein
LRWIETRDVTQAAFAPDGKRLGLFSPGLPTLWDVGTGKLVRELKVYSGQEGAGAFSPDGKALVTVSAVGTLHFWDAATGKEQRQVAFSEDRGFRLRSYRVAFSPDGKLLAVGERNAGVRLWDVTARRFVRTLPAGWVFAFSPDGKRVATADQDNVIRLWDATTGKVVRELRGHEGAVQALVFSPDGGLLASGGVDSLLLWEVR